MVLRHFGALSLILAHVGNAAVTSVDFQIVQVDFSGHVDPSIPVFGSNEHGDLTAWADSSIPVSGSLRYLVSSQLDYYTSFDEGPIGPGEFQTNYYFNYNLGHFFEIELQVGSLSLYHEVPTDGGGVSILSQNLSHQVVSLFVESTGIFVESTGIFPLYSDPVYVFYEIAFVDEIAPFNLFNSSQLESSQPLTEIGFPTESIGYIYTFASDTESGLAFTIDSFSFSLVPEPSTSLLCLLIVFPLVRRRR